MRSVSGLAAAMQASIGSSPQLMRIPASRPRRSSIPFPMGGGGGGPRWSTSRGPSPGGGGGGMSPGAGRASAPGPGIAPAAAGGGGVSRDGAACAAAKDVSPTAKAVASRADLIMIFNPCAECAIRRLADRAKAVASRSGCAKGALICPTVVPDIRVDGSGREAVSPRSASRPGRRRAGLGRDRGAEEEADRVGRCADRRGEWRSRAEIHRGSGLAR